MKTITVSIEVVAFLLTLIIFIIYTLHSKWFNMQYSNIALVISRSDNSTPQETLTQVETTKTSTTNHLKIFPLESVRNKSFRKTNFRFKKKKIMFNLYENHDIITSSLLNHTLWEKSRIAQIYEVMKLNGPSLTFVDIGCNIGIYTLSIATLKYKIICVDANIKAIEAVAKSVLDNRYNNVLIVHNALSDEETPVKMNGNRDLLIAKIVKASSSDVWSIKFDKLLEVIDCSSNTVIIKIDIESFEAKALKYSVNFFDKCQIGAIQMEWTWVKLDYHILHMMFYLYHRGFRPFKDLYSRSIELRLGKYSTWPNEVIWRKLKCGNCSNPTWVLKYLNYWQ